MFNIHFYKDKSGREPIKEYLDKLCSSKSKDGRIKQDKILFYLQILREYGIKAGMPYIKHIDGDIWELRPLRDRIFFFNWQADRFILLHHFKKKTQKTPKREIEQAKRNRDDFIARSTQNEE